MNASLHLLQIVFYFHTLTYVTFAAQVIRSHWDRKPTPGRCSVLMGFGYRHLWRGKRTHLRLLSGETVLHLHQKCLVSARGQKWQWCPRPSLKSSSPRADWQKRPSKTELSYRRKFLTIKIHKIVCRNSVLSVNKHQSQQRVKNTVPNITKRQTWAHDHYWWDHKPTWKDLKTKTVISQGLRL